MAESSNFMQPSIARFDGFYDHWAELMENLMKSKEYWNLIENGIATAPAGATPEQLRAIEESKLKDLKAKNYLYQAIDRSILETILVRNTSKDIWDSMKQKFGGSTKVKRAQLQALRRDFEVLNMKIGETVTEYFARTLSIANKMHAYGETLTQATIVEKILRSLTPRFNYVVCAIEESNDVSTITVDELQSSLLVHEQRMRSQREEEQALKVTNGGRGGRGRNGGYRGRGRGSNGGRSTMLNAISVTSLDTINLNAPAGKKIMQIMPNLMKKKRYCLWHKKPTLMNQSKKFGFLTLDVAITW
jgi:RNase H-fold protein (predicted Holliday junction resolvase)